MESCGDGRSGSLSLKTAPRAGSISLETAGSISLDTAGSTSLEEEPAKGGEPALRPPATVESTVARPAARMEQPSLADESPA